MKVLRLKSPETARGIDAFYLDDAPDLVPGPSELAVQVKAVALNRADLLQSLGLYPPPAGAPRDIPGLEFAGEVIGRGSGSLSFEGGERVCGIVPGGAFAEMVCIHEREALRLPSNTDFIHGAAFPEAFATAFDALVLQGGIRPNDKVLIHAAGSGIGTAAIQLALVFGAFPIGTARSEDKLRKARDLGLTMGIECKEGPRFQQKVLENTGGRGVEVALELVGGNYLGETIESMAPRGRILLVGLLGGEKSTVKLGTILRKRLQIIGTVLRSRPLEEKILVAQAVQRELVPMLEAGKIHPVIDSIHKLENFRVALDRLASNQSFGKVVMVWQ